MTMILYFEKAFNYKNIYYMDFVSLKPDVVDCINISKKTWSCANYPEASKGKIIENQLVTLTFKNYSSDFKLFIKQLDALHTI